MAAPKKNTAPKAQTSTAPLDDELEELRREELAPNPVEVARDQLLAALEVDPRTVKAVDIRENGKIVVFSIDNEALAYDAPRLPRFERDERGRLIR